MNHTLEKEIPRTESEMFTRLAIVDWYCQTEWYKRAYKRVHTDISHYFNLYNLSKKELTANNFKENDFVKAANNIVQKAAWDLLAPHEVGFTTEPDKSISDWGLYLNSTADYLPFDGKEHNGDSRFETLTFDIEKGLEDQWKSGKKKLQEKLALKKKSFQNRGKVQTSKYNLNDVLSHLECLVFRESQTGNERDIAEKYGIPYDTFRGKCNTALKLIKTKEILRFFPK